MYTDDYEIEDDDDFAPPRNPLRWRLRCTALLTLVMIATLLGSSLYQASSILPRLLGYWGEDYRLSIADITSGDCGNRLQFPSNQGIFTSTRYCICGQLRTDGGTADFSLRLRPADERATLGSLDFDTLTSGPFCRTLYLPERLEAGSYLLVATPHLSRHEVLRVGFVVQDNRPDV